MAPPVSAPSCAPSSPRRGRRERRWWWRRTARSAGRCRAAASRAPSTNWPTTLCADGTPRLRALRGQRRRRLRGRADLRRHHRHLRRTGLAQHVSRARRRRRRHRRAPAGRGRHGDRPSPIPTGWAAGWSSDPTRLDGSLGSTRADAAVADDAAGLLAAGRSEVLTYGPDGQRRGAGMEVFVASYAPRPRMLVFGAIDFAAALARQGSLLGYRVTVCDARPVFATRGAVPDRRRGRRRLAPPLPGRAGATRARSTRAPSSACSPTTRSSTSRC